MGSVWDTCRCPDGVGHTFGATSYFRTFHNPVEVDFIKVDPVGICLVLFAWIMIIVVAIAWWTGELEPGAKHHTQLHGDEAYDDL